MDEPTIIGAFARVEPGTFSGIKECLEGMEGISTFDLDKEDKVGILIEAANLDQAHQRLTGEIRAVKGILAVWPVYIHDENGLDDQQPDQEISADNC